MANSVELDEMAKFEPTHLFLHNLRRYIFLSAGLKEVHLYLSNLKCLQKKR